MPSAAITKDRTPQEQAKCTRTLAEIKDACTQRRGMTYYLNFLKGGRLTLMQTLWAKCYQCNGYGEQSSCSSPDCPNYPYYMVNCETD